MLANIKYYAMAFLGFLAILFWGLLQSEKKQRVQEKLKGIKRARQVEKRAVKALVEGLKNEQDEIGKPIDVIIRDHFNSRMR